MKNLLAAIALSLFLFSCGGGEEEAIEETEIEETSLRDEAEVGEVTIELSGNDQMQYSKNEIRVAAGATVNLNFSHAGTMPVEAMGHNFVLLKEGVSYEEFAQKAMTMADNGYLPEDMSNVIAHTNMIGGGESTSITFEAPAAGTYSYVCTFPGHFGTMNGTMIVE